MQEAVTLTVALPVKVLNKVLAMTGQNVLTNNDQIKEFDNLTLSPEDMEDEQVTMACAGLVMGAYGIKKKKEQDPDLRVI